MKRFMVVVLAFCTLFILGCADKSNPVVTDAGKTVTTGGGGLFKTPLAETLLGIYDRTNLCFAKPDAQTGGTGFPEMTTPIVPFTLDKLINPDGIDGLNIARRQWGWVMRIDAPNQYQVWLHQNCFDNNTEPMVYDYTSGAILYGPNVPVGAVGIDVTDPNNMVLFFDGVVDEYGETKNPNATGYHAVWWYASTVKPNPASMVDRVVFAPTVQQHHMTVPVENGGTYPIWVVLACTYYTDPNATLPTY